MLRGERVALAPLRKGDSETLFRWINERDDVVLATAYRPVHARDHEEWFERVRGRPDVVVFGVRQLADDRLIGYVQLVGIDERTRSAEIRVRLGDAASRERGLGTEAVRLLIDHAWNDVNLRRLSAQILAGNTRSLGLFRRVGAQEEGRLRQAAYVDGRFEDVLLVALLRDETAAS